jgi:hypothetical protein
VRCLTLWPLILRRLVWGEYSGEIAVLDVFSFCAVDGEDLEGGPCAAEHGW